MKLQFTIRVYGEIVERAGKTYYIVWMQMEWKAKGQEHALRDILQIESQDRVLLRKPDYISTRRKLIDTATQCMLQQYRHVNFEQVYKGD